jgi:hypothetical protein
MSFWIPSPISRVAYYTTIRRGIHIIGIEKIILRVQVIHEHQHQ